MKIAIEEIINNPWIVGICTSLIATLIWFSLKRYCLFKKSKKVISWLKDNTEDKAGKQFKSTTEISTALHIDEEQVRKICSRHKKIFKHARKEDLWSIHGSEPKSVYDERGVLTI